MKEAINCIIEMIMMFFVVLVFVGFTIGMKNLFTGKTFDGKEVKSEKNKNE